MELNLFSIKVFLEVAEKESFSKAAEAVYLTQPAVSLQIQNLENYLHAPLVIRGHSGKIQLTDGGKILLRHAKKLQKQQRALLKEIEIHTGDSLLQLRVAACSIAGEYLLPGPLAMFGRKYPNVQLSLNIGRCKEMFEGLVSGGFDISITGLAPRHKSLVTQKLVRVPLVVFECRDSVPYPRTASVKELMDKPLILREVGAGTRKEFQKALAKHGVKLKQFQIISVSESNEAIKNLAMKGIGWSILPRMLVEKELQAGVLGEIRFKDWEELTQQFHLIYRKQAVMAKPHWQFLEFMLNDYIDHV